MTICPLCGCGNPGLHVQGCPALMLPGVPFEHLNHLVRSVKPDAHRTRPHECEICSRILGPNRWSRHHLDTWRISERIAFLCDTCHGWIHSTFTIEEIRCGYLDCNEIDALRVMALESGLWWCARSKHRHKKPTS